jgi:hypothetical protein
MGSLKDIRMYEHDRQKAKKAAELVKRKARNSLGWLRAPYESKIHPPTLSGKHERLRVYDVDTLEGLEHDPDTRRMPHSIPSRTVPHKTEVKLVDLVTPRKTRKSNGTCVSGIVQFSFRTILYSQMQALRLSPMSAQS